MSNQTMMTEKVADPIAIGDKEKCLRRKRSLEASVTRRLGYGKNKKRHVEAFYNVVWPVLKDAGWALVKGEGDEEGATYFLPPGVTMVKKCEGKEHTITQTSSKANPASPREEGPWDCASCGHTNGSVNSRCTGVSSEGRCMAWRGGKRLPYFTRVRDVIERVLEKKSAAEAKAADAYVDLVPDNIFTEKKDEKGSLSVPPIRSPELKNIDLGWKDERTHFEKSSSRVGPEFQVDVLPSAGSYAYTPSTIGHGEDPLYERVWNPEEAQKLGRLDFVHTRVKSNKREYAYGAFHSRGYRLPGFYQEVSIASPSDCSDWTKADKDCFRAAVFEKHENMKEVSEMIGKPINECITYYLVKFKRTKSYKSLKRSMKRKANLSEGSSGTLACNECGKGGMLIACDTCEAHYHLACAAPPLESIPDGTWNCGNCKRETRSMLSSSDERSCNVGHNPAGGSIDNSINGPGHTLSRGLEGIATKRSGDVQIRSLDLLVDTTQEHEVFSEDESSSHKRIRMDEAITTAATSATVVPI